MLLRQLKEASEHHRRVLVGNHIRAVVKDILRADPAEQIGPQQKLFELGLKSLDLIDLKHRLESSFSVQLPVTLFFSYSTVESLTDHLLSEVLQFEGEGVRPENTWAPQAAARSRQLGRQRVERLSEEDAERGLLRTIAVLERKLK